MANKDDEFTELVSQATVTPSDIGLFSSAGLSSRIQSVLKEYFGVALGNRINLEPLYVNPDRKDFHRKLVLKVSSARGSLCHLTIGKDLGGIWRRSQALFSACPDLCCRPLFYKKFDEIEFLASEFFDGASLQSKVVSGALTLESAISISSGVKKRLDATSKPSGLQGTAKELAGFRKELSSGKLWGAIDQRFVESLLMPLIESGAMRFAQTNAWSNGDFTAFNILTDSRDNIRLIDHEFAQRTHFGFDDWWRWKQFSALEIPASIPENKKGGVFHFEPWQEIYSGLRHLALASNVINPVSLQTDVQEWVTRLTLLAERAHNNFRSSVFFSNQSLSIRRGSPSPSPEPAVHTAQLFWSSDGSWSEANSSKGNYTSGQFTFIEFDIPRSSEPFRFLRFDPIEKSGIIEIRSIQVSDRETATPLLVLDQANQWSGLEIGGGIARIDCDHAATFLCLSNDPWIVVGQIERPQNNSLTVTIEIRRLESQSSFSDFRTTKRSVYKSTHTGDPIINAQSTDGEKTVAKEVERYKALELEEGSSKKIDLEDEAKFAQAFEISKNKELLAADLETIKRQLTAVLKSKLEFPTSNNADPISQQVEEIASVARILSAELSTIREQLESRTRESEGNKKALEELRSHLSSLQALSHSQIAIEEDTRKRYDRENERAHVELNSQVMLLEETVRKHLEDGRKWLKESNDREIRILEYKSQVFDLEQQLRASQQSNRETDSVKCTLESNLRELQFSHAENWEKLENELSNLRNDNGKLKIEIENQAREIAQKDMDYRTLESQFRKAVETASGLEQQLSSSEDQIAEFQFKVREYDRAIAEKVALHANELDLCNRLEAEKAKLANDIETLKARMNDDSAKCAKLEEQLETLRFDRTRLEIAIKEFGSQLAIANKVNIDTTNKLVSASQRSDHLEAMQRATEESRQALINDTELQRNKIEQLNRELAKKHSEVVERESEIASLRTSNDEKVRAIENLRVSREARENDLTQEIEKRDLEIAALGEDLKTKKGDISHLADKLGSDRRIMEEIVKALKKLGAGNQHLRSLIQSGIDQVPDPLVELEAGKDEAFAEEAQVNILREIELLKVVLESNRKQHETTRLQIESLRKSLAEAETLRNQMVLSSTIMLDRINNLNERAQTASRLADDVQKERGELLKRNLELTTQLEKMQKELEIHQNSIFYKFSRFLDAK